MNNPTRILLRLAALVLMLAGLAFMAFPFVMGPVDAARALGESCAQTRNGAPEQCSILETLDVALTLGGVMALTGFIGVAALRRGDAPALTLNLSRS